MASYSKSPARLQLSLFKPTACVELGKVTVGRSVTAQLLLENEDVFEQNVLVEKISEKYKQKIEVDKLQFLVPPKSSELLNFSWTPTTAGIVSELVTFRVDGLNLCVQSKVVGVALEPPKPKAQKRPIGSRENLTGKKLGSRRDASRMPLTTVQETMKSDSNDRGQTTNDLTGPVWSRSASLPTLTDHQSADPQSTASPRRSTFVVNSCDRPVTRVDQFKTPLPPNPESSPRRETFIVDRTNSSRPSAQIAQQTGAVSIAPQIEVSLKATVELSANPHGVSTEQQERTLTAWVSAILKPKGVEESGVPSLSANDPHKLRVKAQKLFGRLDLLMEKLDKMVDQKKIVIRSDCKIYADVGKKQKLFHMLHSINFIWLRLGLETLFGETLPSDWQELLQFINQRLLTDPKIRQKFAYPGVVSLFKEGFNDAISQHILRCFIKLAVFLDQAASARLIPYNDCLFRQTSDLKSTKALLSTFATEFLSGEGDIFRHLKYVGFTAEYQQTWLHEYDYTVSNLAMDFRDGVRLAKLTEILTRKDLSGKLLNPTAGRTQKIHNVEAVVSGLTDAKIVSIVDPRSIVDGHQQSTLTLLWQMMNHNQKKCRRDTAACTIQRAWRRKKQTAD